MKKTALVAVCLGLCAVSRAATSGDVVVSPEDKGVLVDKFFYDFKINNNPSFSDSKLDDLFITDGFNGVRTPIWGNTNQPAHTAAGVVIGSYYSGHVNMILEAKERNPDLIVFASKKLNGDESFPEWTRDETGVIPAQYAIMLADYIEYMAAQGIPVDVLGIDNERMYNEGNIVPETHKEIVDELLVLSADRGFPMPQIIGHEDFDPDRNDWMSDLASNGWGDRLDIFGTHYYARWRPLTSLRSDLAWAGSREKWHTELHWDQQEEDDMLEAEMSVCAMWDCTDNDMNGLMWWSYARTGFRGSIMKAFSTPLIGAYELATDDVDGPDITAAGKLQTRAFLKGNELTIFAINVDSGTDYSNLVFRVDSGYVVSDVSVLQWTGTNDTAGAASTAVRLDSQSFEFTLPDRSLSSFTFTYAPGGLFSHYAFDGDAGDSSSNAFHGVEQGAVTYPPGREGYALSGTVSVPAAAFSDFLATFWLKTDAANGALLSGDDCSVAMVDSNVVFSIGTHSITSLKQLNDGRWHQVAAERTVADGEMRLFIDGRFEAYGTGADRALSGTNFVLGGIDGLIDGVKAYDRAFGTDDVEFYRAPSVLLTAGGDAEEQGPVAGTVSLSSCPAGADYPYLDLVDDDGTWLSGYNGTSLRDMDTGFASDPVLVPNIGNSCFTRTTDAWWRGVCKPQFDNLLLEAGTYSLSFYVGDADTNALFYSVYSDPVEGNHVGLTATDPSDPVLPDMNASVNSLIRKLDTNVVVNFDVTAVPGDGEWVQWTIETTVPANSPLIGRRLGFLFRKPYSNATYEDKSTGAFDGPLVLGFVPAEAAEEPAVWVDYSSDGTTATAGADCNALPAQLTEGTTSIVPVVDLIEEGPEQMVFSLSASSNFYVAGESTVVVALVDHPMDGWRAEQFGTNAVDPEIAGDTANVDGDRYDNRLEWVLALDPTVAESSAMDITVSDSSFIVTYNRRDSEVTGINVMAEWSESLVNPVWHVADGEDMTEVSIGSTGEIETMAVLVSLDADQKFIRLEIDE
jgi:hypothetical protein